MSSFKAPLATAMKYGSSLPLSSDRAKYFWCFCITIVKRSSGSFKKDSLNFPSRGTGDSTRFTTSSSNLSSKRRCPLTLLANTFDLSKMLFFRSSILMLIPAFHIASA
uniref:GlycinetRNA ligase 2ic/mitochondrial isoform X1 n=1 Tax=Rhizophora mucronata TaxID=61149 RepID=A0A2P2LYC6_RHIMU